MITPQVCCCQCLCPHCDPQLPPTSAGYPPILASRSGPVSYEVTAFFPWVLLCTQPCVQPPSIDFLVPSAMWNSCNQTSLPLEAKFSGASSSHCQTPRLGSLTWGSGLSLLWQNFCGIIVFQFVSCPPGRYGI